MKTNLTEVIALYADNIPAAEFKGSTKIIRENLKVLREGGQDFEFTVCTFGMDGSNYKMLYENISDCKIASKKLVCGEDSHQISLIDSAMRLIDQVGTRYGNTAEEEIPGRIVFVVVVFGKDNASKQYTYEDLHKVVEHQSYIYKWEFFLITDEPSNAEKLGIPVENVVVSSTDTDGYFQKAIEDICVKVCGK